MPCARAASRCRHRGSSPRSHELDGVPVPAVVRPAFTLGGTAAASPTIARRSRTRSSAASGVSDRAGARRGVRARLGRVRARGHARPRGQRRDRLLDREPRPDGRAHRRLGDRCAADDALRRGLPGAARRGRSDHPRRRRRDRRLQHPVRAQPLHGRAPRHRDEPARVALLRARLEGDGVPDREGRGQARRRVHARRDPERPHEDDAGELRADARLRRRQVPALRVREVPRRRPDARHPDEVGRGGDGHRPDVLGGAAEGAWLARARARRAHAVAEPRRRGSARRAASPGSARRSGKRAPSSRVAMSRAAKRAGWGDDTLGEARAERRRGTAPPSRAGHPARVPASRLVRGRGRGGLELLLLDLGRGRRSHALG